jgi:D-alanyl-lipoteichoic acid acyltransferase DltB (MBOAT superfamily)
LLLSFGARGKQRILRSLGVVLLVMLQIVLAWIGYGVPYVAGGLHPINALIILGLLGSTTWWEWKVGRAAGAEPVAAAPPA